ncbi:MAG: sarcosine oxidase subunit delta [Gemmatimonadetes bacterium]|nr:sarcosine oxidase subunit delta [Gemmatimonadota bacterium]
MALRLTCPNCGSRPFTEFWFGGEIRPSYHPALSAEDDYRRLWLPENAAGRQTERWFHYAGCRRWLTVERDTVTNEVHAVR